MSGAWTAASTRARALARRRIGPGGALALAHQPLASALDEVARSVDRDSLGPLPDALSAERALGEALLWRLRVLGGWLPPQGAPLLRAVAALFERDDIAALATRLRDGRPIPEPFDLGSLATAWSRLRQSPDLASLAAALASSAWGRVDVEEAGPLRDQLTLAWLRRLVSVAPTARAWSVLAAANLAAREVLVDRVPPAARTVALAQPFLGEAWRDAAGLADLVAALPRNASTLLRQIDDAGELWLAEARLASLIETDALRTLRTAQAGPVLVIHAVALLAVDAWRTRAALSDAAAGTGPREVLDVVA